MSGSTAVITTVYGQIDGKQTTVTKEVTTGKNLGKKNETTPFQQAIVEANAKWSGQKDKGYTPSKTEAESPSVLRVSPMLAKEYSKDGKKIKYPAMIQPKLDGVRCLSSLNSDGEVHLVSREGKEWHHLNHIRIELKKMLKSGLYIDGELFTKAITFQEITSITRKSLSLDKDEAEKEKIMEYHIYDLIDTNNLEMTFSERSELLAKLHKTSKAKSVKLVETKVIKNEDEMKKLYEKYLEEGYEGAMLRNIDSVYKMGPTRSSDLIKIKPTDESEAKIVDFSEGESNEKGLVLWIIEWTDKNGKKSNVTVRPMGTHEERAKLYKDGKKYIGKKLTIRYQGLTDLGIPRFPRGVVIRDYE
jgi:ATP-dependent DNA ligase